MKYAMVTRTLAAAAAVFALGGTAFAHGSPDDQDGRGYGMGSGMMGQGYGPGMMGPGYGPQMMGRGMDPA